MLQSALASILQTVDADAESECNFDDMLRLDVDSLVALYPCEYANANGALLSEL